MSENQPEEPDYQTRIIQAIEALEASQPDKRAPRAKEGMRWEEYITLRDAVFKLLASSDQNRAVVFGGRCYKCGPYGSLERFMVDVLEKPEAEPSPIGSGLGMDGKPIAPKPVIRTEEDWQTLAEEIRRQRSINKN